MQFSKKQGEILKFTLDNNKYLICDGAVRSGKTVVMSMAFVISAMRKYDGCNFAICSKTIATAERNVLKPLLSSDWLQYRMSFNSGKKVLTVYKGNKVNYFYLFGGKDESSYTLVQGMTLHGALLDEVALMPKSFVEQVIARTLTIPDAKIWFNCNPSGQLHWFNQEWIIPTDNGEKKNAKHLHFLMTDNPIVTEESIEEAAKIYQGVFYKRYILGEWVSAEGLIYDNFDSARHVGTTETEGEYYVSSDFGIQNATVFLLWRRERGTQRWFCMKEYYYSGRDERRQKTVSELADGLIEMLDGIIPKQIIIDPSAAALIVELRKRGYHTREAVNDVVDGISDVATMLNGNLLLFSPECKSTINEFGLYSWDEKAALRGIDAPIKSNDHSMDSCRYLVKTLGLVRRNNKSENLSRFTRLR